MNTSGAIALMLCDGERTVSDIGEALARIFNLADEESQQKVSEFLGRLNNSGFVSFGNAPCYPSVSSIVSRPVLVYYNVTNRCNLNCPFCYIDAGTPYKDELTTTQALRVIDEIADIGARFLAISGGEPLLRGDVFQIARYAREVKRLQVGLITNGTCIIDQKIAEQVVASFDVIQVSLESSSAEVHDRMRGKGTFERTLKAIYLIKENGGEEKLVISPIITALNAGTLLDLLDLIISSGLGRLSVNVFVPAGRGNKNQELRADSEEVVDTLTALVSRALEHSPEMISLYDLRTVMFSPLVKKMSCGMGGGVLSIAANGDVYPCHCLHVADFKAGSLRHSSLSSIYENSQVLRHCRDVTVDAIENCNQCPYRYLCGGGCRASAYYSRGSINSTDPLCEIIKFMVKKKLLHLESEVID